MSDVLSKTELLQQLRQARQGISEAIAIVNKAYAIDAYYQRAGQETLTIKTRVDSLMADADAVIDIVRTHLNALNFQYQYTIPVRENIGYTSLNIDVSNGSSVAELRPPVLTTPFSSVIAAGDVIELSNCENTENNGRLTVASVGGGGDNAIYCTTAISGGIDNADDESVVIKLVER